MHEESSPTSSPRSRSSARSNRSRRDGERRRSCNRDEEACSTKSGRGKKKSSLSKNMSGDHSDRRGRSVQRSRSCKSLDSRRSKSRDSRRSKSRRKGLEGQESFRSRKSNQSLERRGSRKSKSSRSLALLDDSPGGHSSRNDDDGSLNSSFRSLDRGQSLERIRRANSSWSLAMKDDCSRGHASRSDLSYHSSFRQDDGQSLERKPSLKRSKSARSSKRSLSHDPGLERQASSRRSLTRNKSQTSRTSRKKGGDKKKESKSRIKSRGRSKSQSRRHLDSRESSVKSLGGREQPLPRSNSKRLIRQQSSRRQSKSQGLVTKSSRRIVYGNERRSRRHDQFSHEQHRLFDEKYGAETVQALIDQDYHLPGNTWWQDWRAFMLNNHPILGVCFHHPAHPAGPGMRLLALVASISFGLVITNIFYLTWIYYEEEYDYEIAEVGVGKNITGVQQLDSSYNDVQVTTGMLALWFIGGGLNSMFDHFLWTLSTGSFCNGEDDEQTCKVGKNMMFYISLVGVMALSGLASLGIVVRSSVSTPIGVKDVHSAGVNDDGIDLRNVDKAECLEFLLSYAVEMGSAMFVHYPLVGTVLFSGVLGCGLFPVIGGRPREMRVKEEKAAEEAQFVDDV